MARERCSTAVSMADLLTKLAICRRNRATEIKKSAENSQLCLSCISQDTEISKGTVMKDRLKKFTWEYKFKVKLPVCTLGDAIFV